MPGIEQKQPDEWRAHAEAEPVNARDEQTSQLIAGMERLLVELEALRDANRDQLHCILVRNAQLRRARECATEIRKALKSGERLDTGGIGLAESLARHNRVVDAFLELEAELEVVDDERE